jgi:hypothetical protein
LPRFVNPTHPGIPFFTPSVGEGDEDEDVDGEGNE